MSQAKQLESLMSSDKKSIAKFIGITSGKGGVGKSSIAANLAYSLWGLGYRVGVFDADIGLANLDLIFGVKTTKNILHALKGEADFKDALYEIEEGLCLIAGDSGEEILKYASSNMINDFTNDAAIWNLFDYVIVDTGAGISSLTQAFLQASDYVIVVVTPEPSSKTDAYAMLKVNAKFKEECMMIVNMANSQPQIHKVFDTIKSVANNNIPHLKLQLLGGFTYNEAVRQAILMRRLICKIEPTNIFSSTMKSIAARLVGKMEHNVLDESKKSNDIGFFKRILGYL